MRESNQPNCPRCHSKEKVIPIVYGMPSHEAFEAEKRGELILAGCLVGNIDPKWYCKKCKYKFIDSFEKVLMDWCNPADNQKAYFRPFTSRGNFAFSEIYLVGINPATPIYPSDMPLEEYVKILFDFNRFIDFYKTNRSNKGITEISRTRQGMNGIVEWIARFSKSPVVETDVIPYPTSSLKELKKEPKIVIDRAQEIFCDSINLQEPSLLLFHGKKSVDLGIQSLCQAHILPFSVMRKLELTIEEMEAEVPLIAFKYSSGKKGYVVACRHLMYYGKNGQSFDSFKIQLANLLNKIPLI